MGLDYSVEVGYGFFIPGEGSEALVERLGRSDDYEIDGWPDSQLLPGMGYPGLIILAWFSPVEVGGWIVCTEESHRSIDPRESGIWQLNPAEPSAEAEGSLAALHARLFPDSSNGWGSGEGQPEIGWILISSVY